MLKALEPSQHLTFCSQCHTQLQLFGALPLSWKTRPRYTGPKRTTHGCGFHFVRISETQDMTESQLIRKKSYHRFWTLNGLRFFVFFPVCARFHFFKSVAFISYILPIGSTFYEQFLGCPQLSVGFLYLRSCFWPRIPVHGVFVAIEVEPCDFLHLCGACAEICWDGEGIGD